MVFEASLKSFVMKTHFNISIPKPCHEDWSKMTPNEKGKFCNACAKTIVDFTKKSVIEIQEFLIENRHQKVCGYFYKTQLDNITIEIPEYILFQKLSFSKMFLLALLITMGTSLMSCNRDGKKQKIDQIIFIDSLANKEKQIDSIISKTTIDSVSKIKKDSSISKIKIPIIPEIPIINGELTLGIVERPKEEEKDIVFGLIIETPPQFKNAKTGSIEETKKIFSDSIAKFVNSKFDIEKTKKLGLSVGKQRIWAQFTIDSMGNVRDINVRARHKKLEQHTVEILKQLPQFVPGKQRNKAVNVKYTMPIVFIIE